MALGDAIEPISRQRPSGMAFTTPHALAHSNFTRQTCNIACGACLAAQRSLPLF